VPPPSADRNSEGEPVRSRGRFPVLLLVFLAGTIAGMVVCGGVGTAVVALQMERARAAEEAAYQAEMQARSEVEAKEQALREERNAANRVVTEAHDAMLQDLFKEPRPRDFTRRMVMGKAETELSAMLGKPDATEFRDGETCWVYVGRTINPETKQPDRKVVVRFHDGKVADVTFE
jgi:hypothetical protein